MKKTRASKTSKPAVPRSRQPRKARSAGAEPKITRSFAGQVADFIKRYRPALEALAKR